MTTYNDVMIRDGFDDNGQMPYAGTYPWQSPDIIPRQNPIAPGQVQALLGAATWAQDSGQAIENGQINYIYLRASNLGTTTTTATITLYMEKATTMLAPSIWSNAQNTIGSTTITLAPGEKAAAAQPVLWNVPPGTGAYCLIARVVTANNPNPIPQQFPNPLAFYTWVRQYPNVANRNLSFVDMIPNTALQRTLQARNAFSTPTPVLYSVECDNFSVGSTLSVYCPDSSINSGNWIINSATFTQTVSGMLPVGFTNVLVITVTPPPNQSLPSTAQLLVTEWDGVASHLADMHTADSAYLQARTEWLQQTTRIPYQPVDNLFTVGNHQLVKVGGTTTILVSGS